MLLSAVAGGVGATATPTVVVTISTIADQLTLAAVSPTVSATVNGAPATITAWSWKCNGGTSLVTNATTATPTVTPTGAGQHTLSVDVTIDGVVYSSAVEPFNVGKYVASIDQWLALRASIDFTAEATASWLAAGATPTTRSIGGVNFSSYGADKAAEFGLINGSGVRVYHNASATNRKNAPGLYIPIQTLIPGWVIGDPLVAQVQHDVADLADGAGFVALTLCSTVPTSDAAGTYFLFTGYERTATAVHKAFVEQDYGTTETSSSTTTLAGAAHGQEVIHDGNGARFGVFLTDPSGTPPDPGSSTLVPMVAATPSDTGPVAWIRRTPGNAAIDPAGCLIGILHHGNNTGLKRHVERLWVWA